MNIDLALKWTQEDIALVEKDPENESVLINTIKSYTTEQKAKINYDDAVLDFD